MSDEKYILCDNLKCKKTWINPEQTSISVAKSKCCPKKVLLCI